MYETSVYSQRRVPWSDMMTVSHWRGRLPIRGCRRGRPKSLSQNRCAARQPVRPNLQNRQILKLSKRCFAESSALASTSTGTKKAALAAWPSVSPRWSRWTRWWPSWCRTSALSRGPEGRPREVSARTVPDHWSGRSSPPVRHPEAGPVHPTATWRSSAEAVRWSCPVAGNALVGEAISPPAVPNRRVASPAPLPEAAGNGTGTKIFGKRK